MVYNVALDYKNTKLDKKDLTGSASTIAWSLTSAYKVTCTLM